MRRQFSRCRVRLDLDRLYLNDRFHVRSRARGCSNARPRHAVPPQIRQQAFEFRLRRRFEHVARLDRRVRRERGEVAAVGGQVDQVEEPGSAAGGFVPRQGPACPRKCQRRVEKGRERGGEVTYSSLVRVTPTNFRLRWSLATGARYPTLSPVGSE